MTNMHLRNIDNQLINKLKLEASRQEVSMNSLIIGLLRRGVGLSRERPITVYHDLDKLAGTWSKQQAKEFLNEISHFEHIEKDLWK